MLTYEEFIAELAKLGHTIARGEDGELYVDGIDLKKNAENRAHAKEGPPRPLGTHAAQPDQMYR